MMLSCGIKPNRTTFVSLLYACSHAGLVDEGLQPFNMMWDEYDVKHCTCMVNLLDRAARVDEALDLIENMTFEKDEALWGASLVACRIHKKVELAKGRKISSWTTAPESRALCVTLQHLCKCW